MVNIELVNVEEAEKQEERRALAGGELKCFWLVSIPASHVAPVLLLLSQTQW